MTLDHVAPRKGLTAYDRRDNLVLACRSCNEAKRDLAPLAFLLAIRSRAVNLLRYGAHLSPMLLNLARSLVPPGMELPEPPPAHTARKARKQAVRIVEHDDGDSPYRD